MVTAKKKKAAKKPGEGSTTTPPASSGNKMIDALAGHLTAAHPGLVSTARTGVTIKLPGVISTQCATLDAAIGRGGVPMGRVTVVTGGEAAGKTTLLLHLLAETQRLGGVGLYLDLEHKLDVDYAAALGVNMDEAFISQPRCAEDAFRITQALLEKIRATAAWRNVPVFVGLDSINASTPQAEMDSDYDDAKPAMTARFFNKALPKIVKHMSGLRVSFVMVSQPREKITSFGAYKEKISGGNAVKFYAAVVIDVKKKGFLKGEADRNIGTLVEAEVIKNQIARPFQKCEYHIVWGSGVDREQALLARASELGVLNLGASAWYEMPDPDGGKVLKWQGVKGYERLIVSRPELAAHIDQRVRERFV
jgi:recombination protein RecA